MGIKISQEAAPHRDITIKKLDTQPKFGIHPFDHQRRTIKKSVTYFSYLIVQLPKKKKLKDWTEHLCTFSQGVTMMTEELAK